ncbi:hypothetical protein NP233_g10760 [Leucocoprinus birnbaumii]|uniref:Uncharacterized protein n=1 Tax=Leucocoprinus birnbaumii TaxID=56174 RepID=A0AAD5VLE0_9AGAR|nr:hypothetical protein NP233_g10760 [Leucocoprinus birnbaumii]
MPATGVFPRGSHSAILHAANTDPSLQGLMADLKKGAELARAIRGVLEVAEKPLPESVTDSNILRAAMSLMWNFEINGKTSRKLNAALTNQRKEQHAYRNAHWDFLASEKITRHWRNSADEALYANIATYSLPRLKKPYPPRGIWACDSQEINELWEDHIRFGPQPDKRHKRYPPMVVDERNLSLIIPHDESCIVLDPKTNEIVLIVIRNFIATSSVLEWMSEVISVACDTRKCIRMEDTGSIVQIGFSAGARSQPNFHWVRNLLKKFPKDNIEKYNKDQCAVFAFFWNLLIHQLPSEVISDFRNFMNKNLLPVMNPDWIDFTEQKGSYALPVGDQIHTFHGVELAPPQAVMSRNYSRAMHTESQPHKYSCSLTAKRNGGATDGRHFYIGAYGIKVCASENSMIAWQPRHLHGTSLPNFSPSDPTPWYIHQGISFVSSPRIISVWTAYMRKIPAGQVISDAAAKEAAEELWGDHSKLDEQF